eukprot:3852463-Prymnesium_polylepis.1
MALSSAWWDDSDSGGERGWSAQATLCSVGRHTTVPARRRCCVVAVSSLIEDSQGPQGLTGEQGATRGRHCVLALVDDQCRPGSSLPL